MSGRIQAWLAFVLSLAAVLAIAVALQAYAELFNRRFDLTAENRLSLSPYTLSVLAQVEEPLRVPGVEWHLPGVTVLVTAPA